eukprot:6745310-Pyramimonas_sp.AAC.1
MYSSTWCELANILIEGSLKMFSMTEEHVSLHSHAAVAAQGNATSLQREGRQSNAKQRNAQ